MNNAQLTAVTIKKLETAHFKLSDIQVLACGTSSPDQFLPHHGLMTQGELKLHECEVAGTIGICLSGITSLKYGYMCIASGLSSNAVATGSETASLNFRIQNANEVSDGKADELVPSQEKSQGKDFLRWMLSDGAGAMLLEDKPNPKGLSLKIKWIDIVSFAGEMPVCMYCGGEKKADGTLTGWMEFDGIEHLVNKILYALDQDVKLLNAHIVEYSVAKTLEKIIAKRHIKPEDVDYYLPHYSSEYFRDRVYENMKKVNFEIPMEKWFSNLSYKGNTGSASIYIMIEELFHSGNLKSGDKILCHIPESARFSTAVMLLEAVD
jgi:3-oxoacyl-[acyl-carrier-protein] synthase-3